jgi:predicted Kef-type K+ transport protein
MSFNWLVISLDEVAWIGIAFLLGFLARAVGLPPLLGFLAAGFLLGAQGAEVTPILLKISELGITLLLFTIGLKLNLRTLIRPQVWAVATIHMSVVTIVSGLLLFLLSAAGLSLLGGLSLPTAMLIGFALSFSSTVFVVKILEDRGETASLHGRTAIGVLIMQDIVAVLFMAVSMAKMPSAWAVLVVAVLLAVRPLLLKLLSRVGHGELLVLFGLVIALGGAKLFGLVGLKGDLGALVMGVMLAAHVKGDELNKTMLGFKDLFLLGFFLSVGLSGVPGVSSLVVALMLTPLILLKSALFFWLFTRFRLRARTALLGSIDLGNFSEFGLIVAVLAASSGWISNAWLINIALAISLSFVAGAVLNRRAYALYERHREFLLGFQHPQRLEYDGIIDVGSARILIVGMGGVGSGAFERMNEAFPGQVLGVDTDLDKVQAGREHDRNIIRGDPSDSDFWERVKASHSVELVMLALPRFSTSLAVIEQLRRTAYAGRVAAIARYPDEVRRLESAGADIVFNIYSEAGSGFASAVVSQVKPPGDGSSGL